MICVSTQIRSCLTLIPVSRFRSHFNPGSISTPSSYGDVHLTSIRAPRKTSHLHPGPFNINPYLHLISIHVTSHIHLGPPNSIAAPSRSEDMHLNSIQVLCHLHHVFPPYTSTSTHVLIFAYRIHIGPKNCISPSCRSRKLHLMSIQVPPETHPGLSMCVLLALRSCPTCIHVPRILFHLHPCTI